MPMQELTMGNKTTLRQVVVGGAVMPAGLSGLQLDEQTRQTRIAPLLFRKGNDRGVADHGWLRSRHTFSFGNFYDPKWSGFGNLLVINEDRVEPGKGFPTHGHRDMEILSYVLDGALAHSDSMGTGSVIRPGEIQRMSAGTGIHHSEYNASKHEPVHFLQVWIQPERQAITPGYEQKQFSLPTQHGKLVVVASKDGREGSVRLNADAVIHAGQFAADDRAVVELRAGRQAWLHVAKGSVKVGGQRLEAGDAAYTTDNLGGSISIEGDGTGEVLLFDLA
jgi:redox-sensitive bicupin YhaK (pirin superfamily)